MRCLPVPLLAKGQQVLIQELGLQNWHQLGVNLDVNLCVCASLQSAHLPSQSKSPHFVSLGRSTSEQLTTGNGKVKAALPAASGAVPSTGGLQR